MRKIRPTKPVPAGSVNAYRAARLWDNRRLRDGLELAAARKPRALAVADNQRRLTYEELAALVTSGIGVLINAGVGPGDGVVLISGNTVEGVVAYHALLRVGATIVVLDRRCGTAELRHALDLLGSSGMVVVASSQRERLLEALSGVPTLPMESFSQAAPFSRYLSWHEPERNEAAVILFTSGTTNRPKAVIHSLNTLTAGARNMALITGADDSTVAFLVSPLTSITGIMQLHLVADQHAALVLEDRFDDHDSLDRINAHEATLLGGAPVIVERLLRAAATHAETRIALRTLALGGAMLPRPLLEMATTSFGIEVARVYGSSEAPNTTGSLPSDELAQRLLDDGGLMPGTKIRVGSKEHAQEALIRGPAVFLGYVDPADTEAAFEDGWYRTGDSVEIDKGRLTVVGRLKEVVNRNGLKISLTEVDAALARLSGVLEYACFGLPDETTGERLALAVRPVDGCAHTLEAVIEHLQSTGLSVRKLPEQLVVWNEPLPRTASGKIVRSRLVTESFGKKSFLAARLTEEPSRK
jgi:acyl-CoA synthetase (AMP-forming)/AMP-acid ligase II